MKEDPGDEEQPKGAATSAVLGQARAALDEAQADALVQRVEQTAREAALVVCWEQWRSLGAFAGTYGAPRATSIIDPEALVLLSLLLRDAERRLDDFLGWWASSGATLLSVQRAHNLARWFPERGQERLGAFRSTCYRRGRPAVGASPGGGWRVRTGRARGEGSRAPRALRGSRPRAATARRVWRRGKGGSARVSSWYRWRAGQHEGGC